MEYLQQEIKIDIFSRLPIDSVLNCKLVCKSWYSLLHLPYFADMHLHRKLLLEVDHNQDYPNHYTSADKVGFLFLTPEKHSRLGYIEYDQSERAYTGIKWINHPPIRKRLHKFGMVGSCNGLICFSIVSRRYGLNDPVYICNPLTNECVDLPKFDILHEYNKGVSIDKDSSYGCGRVVSGFGYHPLTKEYKIVRIIYHDIRRFGRVQVYTLGSGSGWRDKGEITYLLVNRMFRSRITRGILVNGSLHWIDFKKWDVVAFDLANEEWSLLPLPPFCCSKPTNRHYKLRALGGCLCVVQSVGSETLNLWSFSMSSNWENIISIPENRIGGVDCPITLTRTGELLLRRKEGFICYDPETETTERLFGITKDLGRLFHNFEAIYHNHSFVSLKDLEETSKKIRRNDDTPIC